MTAPLNLSDPHRGRREAILLAYRMINGNPSNGVGNLLIVARWLYYGDDAFPSKALPQAGRSYTSNGLAVAK